VLIGIDHVVIATADPDATAAVIEVELGLASSAGGRHETLGTFNRLIWLGDSYLELIGVFDERLAERSWIGRPARAALGDGGELATWAIASDGLASDLERARAAGAAWIGPIDGERRRDDGRIVRWRLAHLGDVGPSLPFLIEHDLAGAEWTAAERDARRRAGNPPGAAIRLAALELEMSDREADRLFTAMRPFQRAAAAGDPGAAADAARTGFRLGEQTVRIAEPGSNAPRATVHLVAGAERVTRRWSIGTTSVVISGRSTSADRA